MKGSGQECSSTGTNQREESLFFLLDSNDRRNEIKMKNRYQKTGAGAYSAVADDHHTFSENESLVRWSVQLIE